MKDEGLTEAGLLRGSNAPLLAYLALIAYGTWFPIDQWNWDIGGWNAFLAMATPARIPRSDLIINILVYIPLGVFLALRMRTAVATSIFLAGTLGLITSIVLEFGQTYLPGRVSSASDIFLNCCGAAAGAAGSGFVLRSQLFHGVYQGLLSGLRHPGLGRLGLLSVFLWVLSQWAPFVPSLDLGNIKHGVSPLRSFLGGGHPQFALRLAEYTAMLVGLGALTLRLFIDRERAARWFVALVFAVLLGKVLIMTRQLSAEALLAAMLCTVITLWLRNLSSNTLLAIAAFCLIAYQALATFTPAVQDPTLREMNWIPFKGQMNSISGVIDLIAPLWLFSAYAYLSYPRRRSTEGLLIRLLILAPWVLVLEWGQRYVPGRYPDITDVVVGLAVFILAYSYPWRTNSRAGTARSSSAKRGFRALSPWRRSLIFVSTLMAAMVVLNPFASSPLSEQYSLPALDELPNPSLPNFLYRHPRFEAPSADEWTMLQRENPGFVQRRRADAARGRFYAKILLTRVEPAEWSIDELFSELMELEFASRGHGQTIPIALAYDWLYDQWSPEQRENLLVKLEEACLYQIDVIRNKYALSPYNVYLYNRPLQALMMAAISLHGDSTQGDCMRFTYDYWKNRVLPVWSQIMGSRGGWHEGSEYVGIGIGAAVHRLPAMWRRATGQDLFATMPGLRGFLDFAIFRKRPDGTDMRIGDGGHFRNKIPDLDALALEFRHSAAYTMTAPPTAPTPLGFPWGAWTDNSLIDDSATSRLRRSIWFDGIGLLVARSDWSANATYVTFKAGNNYWSHMHLDQGAFTVFKGNSLAIDSGVYFKYGGEHHLNYMYQSVAHNVVTLTDSDENSVLPGKSKTSKNGKRVQQADRQIANDGGQRRVGSGWGLRAPLDTVDWNRQAETYRTAGSVLTNTDSMTGVIWANADLTPAYTNRLSGTGDFWSRSRRVERYLRTFAYLPELDVVLIHDRLKLSKPDVRANWLLHSVNKPLINGSRFEFQHDQGLLRGNVLLPKNANVSRVGGSDREYYIGGKNYDQGGTVSKVTARKAKADVEAGAWRVEISPGTRGVDLEYLVALQVSLSSEDEQQIHIELEDRGDQLQLQFQDSEITLLLPRELDAISAQ